MRVGPLHLVVPFCQAGLAGYSDRAMRLVARRRGCPYAVTEALLDIVMLNGGMGLKRSTDLSDDDHPVAGQLIGSEPQEMARGALILHAAGFDVIDLNFACPVKKLRNRARGGHMLRDPDRAIAILRAVRDALPEPVPTTLKLRRGYDESAESTDAFYRILDAAWEAGYCSVAVHARTVEQKYNGPNRPEFLRDLKRMYPGKVIFGSGDVFNAQDAVTMLAETGVDGVWIARGAIGNPWIFDQATRLLVAKWKTGDPLPPDLRPPTILEQRQALDEHFSIAMEIHGEQLAGRRMRKQGIHYSRFHPQATQVKAGFIEVMSRRQWDEILDRFYGADGPGVWPDPRAADLVNTGDD